MMFGLVLYQLVLIGLFLLNRFPIGVGVGVLCIVITSIFWRNLPHSLGRQCKYGAYNDILKDDMFNKDVLSPSELDHSYSHPMYFPLEQPQPQDGYRSKTVLQLLTPPISRNLYTFKESDDNTNPEVKKSYEGYEFYA